MEQPSKRLIDLFHDSPIVTVMTGAGISVESGIPTFRDVDGLWLNHKPEELATSEAFINSPETVWAWYQWRRRVIMEKSPNRGHYALTEMEEKTDGFTLITQNVDGLHRRAGSKNVIELHGDIMQTYCYECGSDYKIDLDINDDTPLNCHCGGLMRPGVVWFGEPLPEEPFHRALEASRRCDIFFSIGTSTIVYPAAQLPLEAKDSAAYIVEINPHETPLTRLADEVLRGPSGVILPELLSMLNWVKA